MVEKTKREWTPEQLAAIQARQANLLVAAAAGAGKTAVLVERIIRRLTDPEAPVSLENLLVVTFTDAAAAEMRQRIGAALEEAVARQPENEGWRRQLLLLNRATISTIHAFCLRVLRTYFYRLDLDPAFRVMDPAEADLMQLEVMDRVLEEAFAAEPDGGPITDLADGLGGRADTALVDLVLKVWGFTRSLPWPEAWLEAAAAAYDVPAGTPLTALPWYRELQEAIALVLEEAAFYLGQARTLTAVPGGPAVYLDHLEREERAVRELRAAVDELSWEEFWQRLAGIDFARLPAVRRASVDPELKERAAGYRDQAKKLLRGLQQEGYRDEDASRDELTRAGATVQALVGLVRRFEAAYTKEKRRRGLVDFSDLEHLCLQVLLDPAARPGELRPSEVALELRRRYEEVLVDEYQDINSIQDAILTLVSRQGAYVPAKDLDQAGGSEIHSMAGQAAGARGCVNAGTVRRAVAPNGYLSPAPPGEGSTLPPGADEGPVPSLVAGEDSALSSVTPAPAPNLFMVGDVKQSIYRFRLANPELFLEKYRTYPAYRAGESADGNKGLIGTGSTGSGVGSQHPCCRILLKANFRSRQGVVDGVNFIFRQIFSSLVGELEYDTDAALVGQAAYPDNPAAVTPAVEVYLLERKVEGDAVSLDAGEGLPLRGVEAGVDVKSTHGAIPSLSDGAWDWLFPEPVIPGGATLPGGRNTTSLVEIGAGTSGPRPVPGSPMDRGGVAPVAGSGYSSAGAIAGGSGNEAGSTGMGDGDPNPEATAGTLDPEDLTALEREALLVARRIRQMVRGTPERPDPEFQVWDTEKKAYRDVTWRDIVILLRATKDRAPVFLEVLQQNGIPAYADLGGGYFAATEVETILSLLRVIDNPRQDIPLAAVLRSPLVGLTAEELARVRLAAPGEDFYTAVVKTAGPAGAAGLAGLYNPSGAPPGESLSGIVTASPTTAGDAGSGPRTTTGVAGQDADAGAADRSILASGTDAAGDLATGASGKDAAPDLVVQGSVDVASGLVTQGNSNAPGGSLSARLASFLARLERWRTMARRQPLGDVIWQLYRETGYLEFAGGLPGGAQRQANLRALLDRARQFEGFTRHGLFRFLRFIERLQQNEGDLGTARALGENEDVVRVMSIHKAKGLEFPVVIVADLGHAFNLRDLSGDVLLHGHLGLAPLYFDTAAGVKYPTLPYLAVAHRLRLEALSEEARILYVALTRAREKLLLVGSARDLPRRAAFWCAGLEHYEEQLPAMLMARAGSHLDWVAAALARHPQGAPVRELAGVEGGCILADPSCWRVEVVRGPEVEAGLPGTAVGLAPSCQQLDRVVEVAEGYTRPVNPLGGEQGLTGGKEQEAPIPTAAGTAAPAVPPAIPDVNENEPSYCRAVPSPSPAGVREVPQPARDIPCLRREVARRLAWVYPHQALTALPVKLAVTELKRRFDVFNEGEAPVRPGSEAAAGQLLQVPFMDHQGYPDPCCRPGLPPETPADRKGYPDQGAVGVSATGGNFANHKGEADRRTYGSGLTSGTAYTVRGPQGTISAPYQGDFTSAFTRRPLFLQEQKGLTAAEKGTATHLVLQHVDLSRPVTEASLAGLLQQLVEEEVLTTEQVQAVDLEAIGAFFASPLGLRLLDRPDRVRRELPFSLALPVAELYPHLPAAVTTGEITIVQGIIDCLVEEEGGFLLLDFKTGRVPPDPQAAYGDQLWFYSRAVETIFNRPVKEAHLYFLDGGADYRV
ncbi:UvrD-helicase domain-containing protein [Moorella sp. Hama-1]|uniref:UvrD-helicase domain-containing protein n=1 Tax=Moorella sp. Hama-1 TaxID=2138101 RepID=UPI001912298E|nr:UvrD-helicase domain-containing protein [Moorella sp. Hama-1]